MHAIYNKKSSCLFLKVNEFVLLGTYFALWRSNALLCEN